MNILNAGQIFQNIQSMFNQERYWTVLDDYINPNDIIRICFDITNNKIKSVYDILIAEIEKQYISFDFRENNFYAVLRQTENIKNGFLFNNKELFNLFEDRIEAEKYLKDKLLTVIKTMNDYCDLIKLQINEKP